MKNRITPGIPDSEFIRGNVPMTREEVRSVSICKLCLERDSILLDIGAGTGSVTIEAARLVAEGKVISIDEKPEAIDIIKKNIKKFGIVNIELIEGRAPKALENIRGFTRAFIGGSGGNLEEILKWLDSRLPAGGIIVANAVTLETLISVKNFFAEAGYKHGIVEIAVARSEQAGNYTMMKAENPVYIITGEK